MTHLASSIFLSEFLPTGMSCNKRKRKRKRKRRRRRRRRRRRA
jgi:hypothetical protein